MKWTKHGYFILFILLFSYIKSVYQRILVRHEVNLYSFTPDAALGTMVEIGILYLVLLFFLKKWGAQSPGVLVRIMVVSLLIYLVLAQVFGFVIAVVFDNVERNFNSATFLLTTSSYALNGIIYGSFLLGYVYFHQSLKQKQTVNEAIAAQASLRITQLKAQLNPHFLFNNLNILDQLIEEDPKSASSFLHDFADIYRYVLRVSELQKVSLADEMRFVHQYFSLVETKYGNAYRLKVEGNTGSGEVVPMSVQVLLENVVQHNLGTQVRPIHISINISDYIALSHQKVPRPQVSESSGTGLKNLKLQHQMLTDRPIEIQETETHYTVRIPLIYSQ